MTEANPQILVNGKQHEHQQNDAATDGDCAEDSAAEKEAQAKMQSLFQQVRNQIRSQVGNKAPKSSIMELVQKVRDMEMAIIQVDVDPEGKEANSTAELFPGESNDAVELTEDEFCAVFEKKLEASQKALKAEFEEQISQMRREMQAYTDHALKELECKMQQTQEQERNGPDKKLKPSAAPSLASRRGRLLTRTMTTITPKTCAPVIIGPRAKSETLACSKGESSRLLPRDLALHCPGNKPYQSRKPLPPACPPLHLRKKPVQAKAKAGK